MKLTYTSYLYSLLCILNGDTFGDIFNAFRYILWLLIVFSMRPEYILGGPGKREDFIGSREEFSDAVLRCVDGILVHN